MATAEQDKRNPGSEQDYENVTNTEQDYETLTRENTDYARLSDLKLLDSGSFENPEVLDKHPWQHDRPKIRLPLNEMQDTPELVVTPVNSCEGHPLNMDEVVRFQRKLTPSTIMPSYSESESEDEDVYTDPIEQDRKRTESDTINVLGSLCLQGVMQGLVEKDNERRILPDSIRMTVNLEEHCEALDQLSVMVTKNREIVPETPFDPNVRQRKSSPSHSTPFKRLLAKTQLSEKPHSVATSKIDVHLTNVTYIDYIVRPQPLPPFSDKLPLTERKRYKVVESLLESEAAFLTSLNIAIELYRKPLKETANTELTNDQIKYLFGPIVSILEHHELFFSALSEQTKDWSPAKQIGNSFLASFNRKDVLKHYSKYVNNFTKAMSILEKGIKKKHKFYDFLKQQMSVTATPLSLQALLLKPIQRFPQYILFLKDLIKYTSSSHPDSMLLQMAYAHIEGIANSLNEAKHRSEQLTIVGYLNSKIEKLPVNLVKTNQTLVRQDIIQWTHCKDGKWISKERQLFLFSKILVCCAIHQNKKARNDPEQRTSRIEAEQVIGGDTSSNPSLVCKWYCPIESLEMTDPDYIKDNTPLITIGSEGVHSEIQTKFEELQEDMKKLDNDFQLLSKIGALVASLHDTYESLSVQSIQNYCRILQRKLEGGHELMRSCEPCRVDITIPGKGNNAASRYHHVILFESEEVRQNWVRDIQMTKLRQNEVNQQPWINNEDNNDDIDDDEDDLEEKGTLDKYIFSDNLPLVIDYMKLCHNSEVSTVESATSVGSNIVWFATGNTTISYISVVCCFLPTPILVETFPVSSNKILCMKTIPTTDGVLTVWIGSQCGKLMLYDATTKKCLQAVQLPDSILCIENYKNRVFIGTASGQLFVYNRTKGSQWNLKQYNHQISVASSAIQCFCIVDEFLWMGIQKSCVLMNMSTLQLEHGVKVTNDDSMYVKRLEKSGAGVWVALSRGATLYLYHKDTRKPIQEIDIRGSLANIIGYANIESKFDSLPSLHITALIAAAGYLWVGSSVGATLIYRIPHMHGLPLLNGQPFLASDGHKGTVRVLTAVQTRVDVSSVRFDQFVSDEKERMIGSFTIKSSQPLELSTGETTLIQSTAIDERSLPRVSQVIKKLELGKQLLKSSVHDQSSLEAQDTSSLPKPVIKTAVLSKPVPKPRTKKPKKKVVPNITTPADYETPQNLIDSLAQDDPENVYDEVPFEYDQSDEEETIENSSSESELAIDRSRYEGNTIQLGDSLYEHIGLNTITMTIPGHQVNQEQSTMFVFTGGTGLVNYRHGEHSSSQQKSQLIMSLNDSSHLNEVPCVITYQVPK